jgi:hypothetical protein
MTAPTNDATGEKRGIADLATLALGKAAPVPYIDCAHLWARIVRREPGIPAGPGVLSTKTRCRTHLFAGKRPAPN